MTILEAIKGITNYPIPQRTIEASAVRRGVTTATIATPALLDSKEYKLLEADMKRWLVAAPNITEGGVSFSLERDQLRRDATATYIEYEETRPAVKYGYKGDTL